MITVTLSRVEDLAALGDRWRRLEAKAAASFFQSWTWTGCLAGERFPNPVLAQAYDAGETVALALFNRRRGLASDTLLLGETGSPALDCPYIEYNGILACEGREAELTTACLHAARFGCLDDPSASRSARRFSPRLARRLVLSGIDDATLAAARRIGPCCPRRPGVAAPFVDLAALRRDAVDYLDRRSANTRQQLRRSERAFAMAGPLTLRRAETTIEAHAFLDELGHLHQASWKARNEPGCFADPFFTRFHHALIDRAHPRGEIDLLRLTAGGRLIGLLYNFRFRGRALAYQSGFDYRRSEPREKPGLTCHHQAIRFALAAGLDVYDFMAGEDRYKVSLADAAATLHWIEVEGMLSPCRLLRHLRRALSRQPASPIRA